MSIESCNLIVLQHKIQILLGLEVEYWNTTRQTLFSNGVQNSTVESNVSGSDRRQGDDN